MNNRKTLILIVSFLQGGSIMGYELLIPKMIAPFFGSSLYVWSSSLILAMLGLAAGYYFAGRFMHTNAASKAGNILLTAAVFVLAVSLASSHFNEMLLLLPLKQGIVLSSFIHLFPLYALLGMISPLLISLLTEMNVAAGKASGIIFACSTFSGIVFSMVTGFYLIPETGLFATSLVLFTSLITASLLMHYFFRRFIHTTIQADEQRI